MHTYINLPAFKAMIRAGDFVVLDTETTGIQQGEIVQIGIVDAQGNVLLDTLVKPLGAIPYETTKVHGITDAMVADAPGWAAVTQQVEAILRGRHVVVYNAPFDRKMMHQSAERCGLPRTDWKTFSTWWCAMEAFALEYVGGRFYGRYPRNHKLVVAAQHYNIPVRDAHNALGDALMTLHVVRALSGFKG